MSAESVIDMGTLPLEAQSAFFGMADSEQAQDTHDDLKQDEGETDQKKLSGIQSGIGMKCWLVDPRAKSLATDFH